ncbi:MAG: hypothetical protein PVI86_12655, partial [Phycisphaerae bacterium]
MRTLTSLMILGCVCIAYTVPVQADIGPPKRYEAYCLTGGGCCQAVNGNPICCEPPDLPLDKVGGDKSYMCTYQGLDTHCQGYQACCLPDETCMDADGICCDDFGGIAQGGGTTCGTVTCGPVACCLEDGAVCEELPEASCLAQGGVVSDSEFACDTTDYDSDGLVDACDNCHDDYNPLQ